jgi:hypothetical protein
VNEERKREREREREKERERIERLDEMRNRIKKRNNFSTLFLSRPSSLLLLLLINYY